MGGGGGGGGGGWEHSSPQPSMYVHMYKKTCVQRISEQRLITTYIVDKRGERLVGHS